MDSFCIVSKEQTDKEPSWVYLTPWKVFRHKVCMSGPITFEVSGVDVKRFQFHTKALLYELQGRQQEKGQKGKELERRGVPGRFLVEAAGVCLCLQTHTLFTRSNAGLIITMNKSNNNMPVY